MLRVKCIICIISTTVIIIIITIFTDKHNKTADTYIFNGQNTNIQQTALITPTKMETYKYKKHITNTVYMQFQYCIYI